VVGGDDDRGDAELRDRILRMLRDQLRPEFLNRIDAPDDAGVQGT
jgi:ATP-dependent Clp protease ATP-binding subunit ClpA